GRARASRGPARHDEPALHLEIYKELFSAPAGIAYNTDVERRFLTTHFSMRAVEEETVGWGVDLSQERLYQRDKADEDKDDAEIEQMPDEERPPSWRPHLAGRGVLFKRRHRLHVTVATCVASH